MIPRCSTDTRGKHLPNVYPADEQDVKPYGKRLSRNIAEENDSIDRSPRSNLAGRTKIFFPDGDSDDPREPFRAEHSRWSAVGASRSLVPFDAALASDGIVPDVPRALSR